MKRLALDRGYETGAVRRGLELLGITGYIPAIQFSNPPEKYGFSYDPQQDAFICPEGVPLTYHRLNCNKSTGKYLRCYQVEGDACMRCSKRPSCFDKAGIRRRVAEFLLLSTGPLLYLILKLCPCFDPFDKMNKSSLYFYDIISNRHVKIFLLF